MATTQETKLATITLTIDGQSIQVEEGSTVLDATRVANIYVPTLCYHPILKPTGTCRMCIVEIEGMRGFTTSCTTPVTQGMIVRTNTPEIQELRRNILELILSEHPYSCLLCDRKNDCDQYHITLRKQDATTGCKMCPKNQRCELQKVVEYVGLEEIRLQPTYRELPVLKDSPFFDRNYNLCILCGRCIQVCQEIRGAGAISFNYRSSRVIPGTAYDKPLLESGCQSCGACVDICPTGALAERIGKWKGQPDHVVQTTCPYCGVGCQLGLEIKNDKIIRVTPTFENAVNKGQACVKGRFGITEFVHNQERLTTPLIRKNGELVKSSWDDALNLIKERLPAYKGDAFAFISSAKCTNEENYLAQKFTRAVMQTNNIDHCARL